MIVLYFSIYIVYFSKCLSEWIYLPYARLLEHVFAKKMSFDMKKVLLITGKRWKKEEPPER